MGDDERDVGGSVVEVLRDLVGAFTLAAAEPAPARSANAHHSPATRAKRTPDAHSHDAQSRDAHFALESF